ncbi:hypothetical protein ACRQ1B_22900 [Rhizobium panacihumi]|uniref:hypothetical protein n=1 Tax=Rhizobium panacihumi TaxID=2008450 RepID=UPI003D7B6557
MSDADRMKKVLQKNFREQRKHIALWVSDPFNKEMFFENRVEEVLEPFLADGSQKKSLFRRRCATSGTGI